ncbi:MAG: hypothetical protein NXI04_21550 [Planctomycetaceae bacterium]|nr:hypothetical protein [Planctomycetaceae bacterium]
MSATIPARLSGLPSGNLSAPKTAMAGSPHRHSQAAKTESAPHDGPFSPSELEQFRADDAAAGRTICTILTTLFTVCVLLATGVITWTFLYAISPA